MRYTLAQRLGAEFLGTASLLATIVGSGIMAERLSGGNFGLALLAHVAAIAEMLFVLILMMTPISGAHFNPAVTLALWWRKEIGSRDSVLYVVTQIAGAVLGVLVAHMMFNVDLVQIGSTSRTGAGQWFGEVVATFGLMMTIFAIRGRGVVLVSAGVALYIASAAWFTASTSFANPAVTLARSLTDTFTAIRPENTFGFILAQLFGTGCALLIDRFLFAPRGRDKDAPEA